VLALKRRHFAFFPVNAGFPSLIVADFPTLFAEVRRRRLALLWRDSRDGFGARDFHSRCDSHTPILPLVQDTGHFQGLHTGEV
jgi:hypothetical protein